MRKLCYRVVIIGLFATVLLTVPAQVRCQEVDAVCLQSIWDTSDLQLLKQAARPVCSEREVAYGFVPGKRTLNPFYHMFSSAMYVYQKYLSSVLSRQCAFSPTCSGYSKALIKEYGLCKGVFCTADRLMRCNRIALSDKDAIIQMKEGNGHIHESVARYHRP